MPNVSETNNLRAIARYNVSETNIFELYHAFLVCERPDTCLQDSIEAVKVWNESFIHKGPD
jgi:hypothetical protein